MSQLPTGQVPVEPVVPVQPAEGSAEYNVQVAMQAPANIPAKFRNVDGTVNQQLLLDSYKALEQMQRGQTPDPTAGVPVPSAEETLQVSTPPSAEPTAGSVDEILSQEKAVAPTINWDAVRSGTASEDDVANIKQLGVPEDFIKQFAADRQAARAASIKEVAEAIGGEENLKATLNWAKENKSEAEWDTLRAAVSGGDNAKTLLIGLHAQYVASQPKESGLVVPADGGVGATTPQVLPYPTQQEMFADMDKRDTAGRALYEYDTEWQRHVAKRIFVTNGGDVREFDAKYRVALDY